MKDYTGYHTSSKDKLQDDAFRVFQKQIELESQTYLLDTIPTQLIVRQSSNPLNEFKEERKVIAPISTPIHRGSIVEDTSTGEKYLVISDIDNNGVYKTGKMVKCNNTLKWQDEDGNVVEYPCVMANMVLYSDGLYSNKIMTLPDGKLKATISYDDNTKKLKLKKRFIVNHRDAYEITNYDDITQPGVIGLIMSQDLVGNINDDLVNGIAYNEQTITTPDTYTLSIINNQNVTVGYYGAWQIQWEVKKNGIVVNEPVNFISSNTGAVTVNTTGFCQGKAVNASSTITVKLSSNPNIYATVKITVSNITHNYTVDITGDSLIYLGESKNYTATVKDMGISVPSAGVVWEINYNNNPQTIVQLQSNNNTATLKANNVSQEGIIYLIAKYANDLTKQFSKSIEIKNNSLW